MSRAFCQHLASAENYYIKINKIKVYAEVGTVSAILERR
jgi:hypothetical protein